MELDQITFGPSNGSNPKKFKKIHSLFLKGPVPLDWLATAARSGGSSISVGVVIWFFAGLNKSETLQLRPKYLRMFGVSRFSSYRALQRLEAANLVTVKRKQGSSPEVTIIRLEKIKDKE